MSNDVRLKNNMNPKMKTNPTINRSNEKPNENGIKVIFTISKPVIAEILGTAAIMFPSLLAYLLRPKPPKFIFMPPLYEGYEGVEFVAEPLSHPEFKEAAEQIVFAAGDKVRLCMSKVNFLLDQNKFASFNFNDIYTVYSAIECGDGFTLQLSGNLPQNVTAESFHSKFFTKV
jgi:hypothetical protein